MISMERVNNLSSSFCSQVAYNITILKSLCDSLNHSKIIIEKSQKLIEVSSSNLASTKNINKVNRNST